jgi:nitrogenase molybdenum-iron protein alpha/beta subunit
MVIEILTWLDMNKKETVLSKVNLIGISLYQRNWDSDIEELKRLLSMLNVDVGTVICAGTSKEELINSTDAALNIVVYPEFGLEIARWYERKFNIPFILSEQGAPVGHIATMKWLEIVAEAFYLDSKEALDICKQKMKRAVTKIARFHSLTGLPKGATFSIKADSSVALPLTYWLYHYLGMAPVNVETLSGGHDLYERKLEGMLESLGFKDSWNGSVDGDIVDVILADGHTVNTMVAKKRCKAGIEICMPSSEYIDFLPRTITGLHGTLFLLEEILNSLRKNL